VLVLVLVLVRVRVLVLVLVPVLVPVLVLVLPRVLPRIPPQLRKQRDRVQIAALSCRRQREQRILPLPRRQISSRQSDASLVRQVAVRVVGQVAHPMPGQPAVLALRCRFLQFVERACMPRSVPERGLQKCSRVARRQIGRDVAQQVCDAIEIERAGAFILAFAASHQRGGQRVRELRVLGQERPRSIERRHCAVIVAELVTTVGQLAQQ
jgi:hypothetical protein